MGIFKVAILDVDGHNWPNLCLMKLSAFHKARGDTVEWHDGRKHYDLVYMSRVFTDSYSRDYTGVIHADAVIRGGTGYGLDNRLPDEAEHTHPDYGLYPQFAGTAYGFLSRGCPRGCGFCIVGDKEGRQAAAVADLDEFWGGEKEIKLLDANILACPDWERLLGQLADSGAWVDFTQGLDIRLMTLEKAAALNLVKTKMLHFAWDDPEEDLLPYFKRFLDMTSVKDYRKRRVYVLTNYGSTTEQDLYRIYALRDMGYDPFVMVYEKPSAPQHEINHDNIRIPYHVGGEKDRRKNPKGKSCGNVWECPRIMPNYKEATGHPTQKPEKLSDRILSASSRPGDLVLIPFAGSGSEIVSCIRKKRDFIAAESNPVYVREIIRPRIEKAAGEDADGKGRE